jgi:hypothetical protein
VTVDMQLALDHGGVRDDLAIELQHEMETADRMVPVVVAECFVVIGPERGDEQLANGRDLRRGQFGRRDPAQPRSTERQRAVPASAWRRASSASLSSVVWMTSPL